MSTNEMNRREFLAATGAGAAALAVLGGAARAEAAALPAWVSNLPLWHWHAIPGTALASVDPKPRPIGATGPSSKIVAWCGATLRRAGSVYMLGAAGGHADYAGNEVDALRLNTATPAWTQLRGPTPNEQVLNQTPYYLDLRPAATHTYYATQFIESLGRMVVFCGGGLNGLGAAVPPGWAYNGNRLPFSFDTATNDWDAPGHIPPYPGTGDATACLCVKHPGTDDVYYSRNSGDGWYRWTRSSNAWVKLSNLARPSWYSGAAIDPVRGRMLIVGAKPEVRDLNGNIVAAVFGGLGAAALTLSGGYPGVMYDEALDRFLVVHNEGGAIRLLRVHPQTWVVDQPAVTGAAPAARQNGLHNAAQYAPELGGFALANSHGGNVLFMRTSATPAAPAAPVPVDTTPPRPPGGLTVG